MKTITAQELHVIRIEAIRAFSEAVNNAGPVLDAINAIADYAAARQAWHDENSGSSDPPIWIDPWEAA